MTTALAIRTVLEIVAVLFVIYGVLHEDKFIAFEDKVIRMVAKKIYLHKRRKAIAKKKAAGKAHAARRSNVSHSRTDMRYAA